MQGICNDTCHNYNSPIQELITPETGGSFVVTVAYLCTNYGDITPKKDEKK